MTSTKKQQTGAAEEAKDEEAIAVALLRRASRDELERYIADRHSHRKIIQGLGESSSKITVINIQRGKGKYDIVDVTGLRGGLFCGSFDVLNDESVEIILSYLTTREKVPLVLFVCKSFYTLRKVSRLWK